MCRILGKSRLKNVEGEQKIYEPLSHYILNYFDPYPDISHVHNICLEKSLGVC